MTTMEAVSPRKKRKSLEPWGLFTGFLTIFLALVFGFPAILGSFQCPETPYRTQCHSTPVVPPSAPVAKLH